MKLLLSFAAVLALSPLAAAADLTGAVVESSDAGGYTYILIKDSKGEKTWAAVTKTSAAKKGSVATITNSMEMRNFESPTTKKKFDRILFGQLADAGAAAPSDPHAGLPKNDAKAAPAAPAHGGRAEVKGPIKVTKAAGPDARTIEEVYAQKAALKGKDVVVTGKVVKYNSGILERNWAHLRDGSGKAKDGSDDLTVILKDDAAVDQVITVKGKVVLNKDLGGMYRFPVALEDAVLVK